MEVKIEATARLQSFLASWDDKIVTRRLHSLYRELTEPPMKIRITERTVFQGKVVQPGTEIDGVEHGPYRSVAGVEGNAVQYVAQFEEMTEETITVKPADVGAMSAGIVAAPAVQPQPEAVKLATFADAAKVVLAPAPVMPRPAGNPLAARVRALTARQAKFHDVVAGALDQGEALMTRLEADSPAILERAVAASHDKLAAITDLADSLKEMDQSN